MRLFIKVSIGQQRDVIILTLPIAIPNDIGGVAIGIFKRKIKLENFEKLMIDSYFSLPKAIAQTLDITAISPKRGTSLTKTTRS
jgi:hypothetical protein